MKTEQQLITALKEKGVECEADEFGMSITIDGVVFTVNAEDAGPCAVLEFSRHEQRANK